MVLASAAVPAAQLSLEAESTTVWLAKNTLWTANETKWRTGVPVTALAWTGADESDATRPGSNAYDGRTTVPARAADPASDSRNFSFFVEWSEDQTIDTLMLRFAPNNNGADLYDILVHVDDTNDFTTNDELLMWLATTGGEFNGARRVCYFSNTRYTGIRYMRVSFIWNGAGVGAETGPDLLEVFAGQRRPMPWNPNDPWADEPISSDFDEEVTRGRDSSRIVHASGFASFEGTYDLTDQQEAAIANETSVGQARNVWRDCEFGSRNVVLWPKSSIVARGYLCRITSPDQPLENIDFGGFTWDFEAEELPPFVQADKSTVLVPSTTVNGSFVQGF